MTLEQQQASRRLGGLVAVVTGASRGLGRAIALALGAEGASVVVAARTVEEYDERLPGTVHDTVAEITASGGQAWPVQCDVAVEEQLEQLIAAAHAAFGPVQILVNNAALTVPGRPPASASPEAMARPRAPQRGVGFLDFPLKGFRRHLEVNLFAPYRLMQLVLPGMIAAGRGSIINIGAEAARVPGEGPYPDATGSTGFAYGGSKAGLEHLTRAVAYEVARYGVSVNTLVPSLPIRTPGVIAGARTYATDQFETEVDFAAAAVDLSLADPRTVTGQILYSQDILHPELGRRRWLGGRLA
jgi:7-alpha-hydroxysteroid dehydrogenase